GLPGRPGQGGPPPPPRHSPLVGRQRALEVPQLGVAPADLVVAEGDEAPVVQLAIERTGALEKLQGVAVAVLLEVSLAQSKVGIGHAAPRTEPLEQEQSRYGDALEL